MNADKIIQCILAAMLKLEKTVDSDLNDKLNHGGYQGNAQDLSDSIESIYQPDTVIRYTAPTRVGNTFTFPSAGYDVLLSKQFHTNVSELETTIAAATDGFKRIDLIYYKADDTIAKIQGTESTTVAVRPEVPAGGIILCLINVFGATIEVPEVNGGYVQKSERANVVLTGSGVINQLNLVDEKATIVFKGSITQLNTISYASVPYNGKRITLFNAQATPVTIGHSVSGYGVDFVFPDGQDYVLKPNETIEFSFDITYAPYAHHRLIGAILDISGKEDESNKGAPNGYAPLDEFTKLAAQYLNIVNDLVTGGATNLLSAQQGVVLQTRITAINTILSSDDINLDTIQELVDAIKTFETSLETILVNDLTTGGTTKALTAEMGKTLKELVDALTLLTNQKLSLTGGNLTGNTGFGVPNPLAKIHSDGTVIHKNLTNAQGDPMFTKQVVAKTDGTFGVRDLPSADSWSSPISLVPFLANGVTSPNASYRRKGNVIQLTLSVSGATPLNTFITLPPELRHAGNFLYLTAQVSTQPRLLVFSSDGTIKTFDGSNIAWGEISLMAQYSV